MRKLSVLLLVVLFFIGQAYSQQRPEVPAELQDFFENYQPKPYVNVSIKSAEDYDLIYYIDPDYQGTNAGTIDEPYSSWDQANFQENAAYLQKRGTSTVVTNARTLSNNILLGAYGEGDRPVIVSHGITSAHVFRFAGDNNTFRDLHIARTGEGRGFQGIGSTYHSSATADQRPNNNVIYNNVFVNTTIVSWSTNLRILNNTLYYQGQDPIFLQGCDFVELGYNDVIRPNQSYNEYTGSGPCPENECHGDGIQLDMVMNWYAYGNYILRDDTGNKFGFIANRGDTGLAEANILVGPSQEGSGNAVFYIGGGQDNIDINHNYIVGPAAAALFTHAALTFTNNVMQGEFWNSSPISSSNSRAVVENNIHITQPATIPAVPTLAEVSTGDFTIDDPVVDDPIVDDPVIDEPVISREVEQGGQVTLTAQPTEGWIFVRWQGDVNSTDNPLTIIMDSDTNIEAVFEEETSGQEPGEEPVLVYLTVTVQGEGNVIFN